MAKVMDETESELLPVEKYMQAVTVCNNLALLASQGTMIVFVQRISLLKKIQNSWTRGEETEIMFQNHLDPISESEILINEEVDGNEFIEIKPEADASSMNQMILKVVKEDFGNSSDDTIVDEVTASGTVSGDENGLDKQKTNMYGKQQLMAKKERKIRLRLKHHTKDNTEKTVMKRRQVSKQHKKSPKKTDLLKKHKVAESVTDDLDSPSSSYNFLCLICKEVFTTYSQLREHKIQTHDPSCGTQNESFIKRNCVLQTKVKKTICCSVCEKSFKFLYLLKRHMMSHTGDRPYMCNHCGMRFAKKDILKSHLRVHSGEKPFKCGECNMQFIQASNLTYHIRSHHTDEKPFICTECGKQFRQSTLLKYHMRIHTGERPLACSFCDRRFARPTELREHRKLHSDAKTYICRDCGKMFKLHSTLNKHRKVHWDIKPFSCNECSRTFTQLYNLKTHMRTHTGQKPYTCEQCGKVFAHQGTLKKHFEVHAAEKS